MADACTAERQLTAEPQPEAAEQAACLAELAAARAHTDSLFALLEPAALYERGVAERHRFIFYLGHLEAFDWNLCRIQLELGERDAESGLDRLFAFGIDPDPGDPAAHPHDLPGDWPAVAAVQKYCTRRRSLVDAQAERLPLQLLHVAIEHRLMHAETLCYLMHWLSLSQKRLVAPPRPDPRPAPLPVTVTIPAGLATLGRCHGFGWDNEHPEHAVQVPEFRVDRYKVSNAAYLKFVRDGGPVPLFWIPQRDGGFQLRCMFGEIPLPLSWPVYTSFENASAYAAWADRSIISEIQFHRSAFGTIAGAERSYPWGEAEPEARHGCFDFHSWDPQPVDAASPAGDSAFGVTQLVGNGWEWTSSEFAPLPGFAPFPFYRGYSADFFDGQHRVLKGGSARTARRLLRRSFRNFYRTNYPYVYAGFRCVD